MTVGNDGQLNVSGLATEQNNDWWVREVGRCGGWGGGGGTLMYAGGGGSAVGRGGSTPQLGFVLDRERSNVQHCSCTPRVVSGTP